MHLGRDLLSKIALFLYAQTAQLRCVTVHSPSGGVWAAKYCDERVCVSVCPSVREDIPGTTCPSFTKFSLRVSCGLDPVLVRWHCNTLRASGFVDDVDDSHYLWTLWRSKAYKLKSDRAARI